MFIKSIILDGFKSYGTRTEIKGFDPEFNAITGLNGTGKSNILDSICFVLGISNLSHVRANSLQDLIYKSGQAGVTKASVTIVFDNSDTSKSPINYEQCDEITVTRQIVVAGKNRYMINGSTVTNKHVNDFFSSIQLNVNNPHFLIMQGRITKVLNMKPPEILSMIEEAAGTRMYENKKQGAQKTIEKKDTKLKEMNVMVTEQINPKIEKLHNERSQYIEYQKASRELDHALRIYSAWQFLQTDNSRIAKEKEVQATLHGIQALKDKVVDTQKKITEIEAKISELHQIRDRESGGKLQEMEQELKEKEKLEATVSAQLKSANETVAAEIKKQKHLEKILKDDEKALASKMAELGTAKSVFDSLRQAEQEDAEALAAAQRKFQAVSSGLLSNDDGQDSSLQDQLMLAKQQLAQAETEVKQCNMQLEHSKKELKTKEPKLKQTEMLFAKDKSELQLKEREVAELQNNLQKMKYEDGMMEKLEQELRQITSEMRNCSEIVNTFEHRYPQLTFQYKDPEPNFNRDSIKGLLCKLFTVKDQRFARALETAAGGKLYNVVVDSESTSSKLIQKGQLLKRTTFAPLNKVHGNRLNENVVRQAQHLVGNDHEVYLAQSLVEYDPKYESLMSWVFGQTFICSDGEAAFKLCYNPNIKRKAITLDGDVYDPMGTISGGAVSKQEPILAVLAQAVEADKALEIKQAEKTKIEKKIQSIANVASSFENIKQKLALRQRELDMINARLQQTAHYQLQKEIDDLKESINEKSARISECQNEIKEKSAKVKELENKMKNLKSIREAEMKTAEAELKRMKKKAEDSRNNWKKREQEFETLNLEIQELEKCVITGKEQIVKSEETRTQCNNDLSKLTEEFNLVQNEVKTLKGQVKEQKNAIGQKNKEIQQLTAEKDSLIKAVGNLELETASSTHNLGKLKEDVAAAEKILDDFLVKHKWIERDREYFGQPNGMYDFNLNNPQEAAKTVKRLNEYKEKLGRNINSKAMDMLGTQEEQFQEVMNKKGIIEEDRSKILSVIEELDVKKEEVIRQAWEVVNHDFNSILSSLLPSAHAKLKPVDGKDFLDGLEVKVGFGGIWKESLDELSGGQRSLVALSLILAMLLFKPAPLYILDEVDAALDPSHTQNIGQMLKAHFRQSQFIIVSLKDGMFNNANVLFRTSFVDGMSAVIRTTNTR